RKSGTKGAKLGPSTRTVKESKAMFTKSLRYAVALGGVVMIFAAAAFAQSSQSGGSTRPRRVQQKQSGTTKQPATPAEAPLLEVTPTNVKAPPAVPPPTSS